jgi:hypothetical protein
VTSPAGRDHIVIDVIERGGSRQQKLITLTGVRLSAASRVVNPTQPAETRLGRAH